MAIKSERERALQLAAKWEREAHDLEAMSERSGSYTPLECRMMKLRANDKRVCANELKLEFATVSRG